MILIEATVIPHKDQRYPSTGDYFFGAVHPLDALRQGKAFEELTDALYVRVSAMPDERYQDAVFVHEIYEALLCKHAGIPEPLTKRFDELYEGARPIVIKDRPKSGKSLSYLSAVSAREANRSGLQAEFGCNCIITDTSEPGDDIHAPYYKQHQLATGIERIFIAETGADWNAYEKANQDLYDTDSR